MKIQKFGRPVTLEDSFYSASFIAQNKTTVTCLIQDNSK